MLSLDLCFLTEGFIKVTNPFISMAFSVHTETVVSNISLSSSLDNLWCVDIDTRYL